MSAKFTSLIGGAVAAALSVPAFGMIAVDGKFDGAGAYTNEFTLDFIVENTNTTGTGGKLYFQQDATTKDVFILFQQPKTLVDNSYGTTAVGWGSNAPSGKNHKWKDLLNSDKAEFTISFGGSTIDIVMDYLIDPDGPPSGVLSTSVSGTNAGQILNQSSSAVYNASASVDPDRDHSFDGANSPATNCTADDTDPNCYTVDITDSNYESGDENWIFDVNYELQIDGGFFGNAMVDAATVAIGIVHDSPNKLGKNKVKYVCGDPGTSYAGVTVPQSIDANQCGGPPPPDGTVPEPGTVGLFGLALLGLGFARRRWAS